MAQSRAAPQRLSPGTAEGPTPPSPVHLSSSDCSSAADFGTPRTEADAPAGSGAAAASTGGNPVTPPTVFTGASPPSPEFQTLGVREYDRRKAEEAAERQAEKEKADREANATKNFS